MGSRLTLTSRPATASPVTTIMDSTIGLKAGLDQGQVDALNDAFVYYDTCDEGGVSFDNFCIIMKKMDREVELEQLVDAVKDIDENCLDTELLPHEKFLKVAAKFLVGDHRTIC